MELQSPRAEIILWHKYLLFLNVLKQITEVNTDCANRVIDDLDKSTFHWSWIDGSSPRQLRWQWEIGKGGCLWASVISKCCYGKCEKNAMVYVLKHFFLNIEDARSLSNTTVNNTNNLGKIPEKDYRKITKLNIVAKSLDWEWEQLVLNRIITSPHMKC